MRNVLAHAGKRGRRIVSAFIATAVAQDDAEAAMAPRCGPAHVFFGNHVAEMKLIEQS